jgi:hypothetical protein
MTSKLSRWTGKLSGQLSQQLSLRFSRRSLRPATAPLTLPFTVRAAGSTAVTVSQRAGAAALLALFLCCGAVAQVQDAVTISDLSPLDQQYMDRQRELVDQLARLHLGSSCCDAPEDLPLLQRLLDEGVIENNQRPELQAMGIVLGDILAQELGMHWVIYEDRVGRSRALRLGDTDNYLFPVTMISRRREANNLEPVESIYANAYGKIEARMPPRPMSKGRVPVAVATDR